MSEANQVAYFSFGQCHTHRICNTTLDCDCILKITDPDPRAKMFELFGRKWSMQYDDPPDMRHYPRGIIEL